MVFDSGPDRDAHALERLERRPHRLAHDGHARRASPRRSRSGSCGTTGRSSVQRPAGARNANIATNPRVSFHLNDDGKRRRIVVIEGEARVDPSVPPADDNAGYLAKYGA